MDVATRIKKPSTALTKARDLLAEGKTWCTGELAIGGKKKDGSGHPVKFCSIGAVDEACGVEWEPAMFGTHWYTKGVIPPVVDHALYYLDLAVIGDDNDLRDEYLKAIDEHGLEYGPVGDHVVNFNDHEAKTVKQVIAKFDEAIALARQAERAGTVPK